MRKYSHAATLILIGMGLLFVDFLTKAYVYYLIPTMGYSAFYPYGGIGVFQNFLGGVDFSISLAINRGAAWGFFADFQILLLVVRILVILGMLLYLIFINQNRLIDYPLTLMIVGALGNVVDFFLYGYVVDFFHFNLWGYRFPVFNVADSAITVGVIWLFILACVTKSHDAAQKHPSP